MPLKAGKGQPEETEIPTAARRSQLARQAGRSGQLEHRRETLRLRRLEPRPAVGAQLFERTETRLISHARRAFDPVTELDIGQPGACRALDRSEEHTSALQSLMRHSYAVF